MRFFVGLHQPSDAQRVMPSPAFISVNRLRNRRGPFVVGDWIMDSGAFSTIAKHGGYPHHISEYAEQIARFSSCGNLLAAVAQDFMCEPAMLARTSLTVREHQGLTIQRYVDLLACNPPVYIMPVLQGYAPAEYVEHVRAYGSLLAHGALVGVGSVCKRNGHPSTVAAVLRAIHRERPDLRLHGFGLKTSALHYAEVRDRLHSADSMAWSYAARMAGRNGNDWREAAGFAQSINGQAVQLPLGMECS